MMANASSPSPTAKGLCPRLVEIQLEMWKGCSALQGDSQDFPWWDPSRCSPRALILLRWMERLFLSREVQLSHLEVTGAPVTLLALFSCIFLESQAFDSFKNFWMDNLKILYFVLLWLPLISKPPIMKPHDAFPPPPSPVAISGEGEDWFWPSPFAFQRPAESWVLPWHWGRGP